MQPHRRPKLRQVWIYPDLLPQLTTLAKAEHRSLSNMVAVLLAEALAHRQVQGVPNEN